MAYQEENTRCAFLPSLLMGRALDWASAILDSEPQVKNSFIYFSGLIHEVFEYPAGGRNVAVQLLELRQGTEPAADYAVKFHTLVAQSGWNDPVLHSERDYAQPSRLRWPVVAPTSPYQNILTQPYVWTT